ncbi:hypothetical protein DPMN_173268 [Dreissena polymorpha]|uniref:Uncharacterized protein n=1 Tax=Dreissena polymorpha TaxID=45954 RepID=A0A9D4E192_DREPO|nr:hypothetical protein DPMN_173268 [Dreissena polymorpha]
MSRIAACLGGQMRSFAAKCDLLTRLQRLTQHRLDSPCRRGSRNMFVPLWLYCRKTIKKEQ